MREHELGGRLREEAERIPEPDLAVATWERGRRVRRRRFLAGMGCAATAAAAAVALLVVPGAPRLSTEPAGEVPAGAAVLDAPPPVDADRASGAELRTWTILYTACLEEVGYDVDERPTGLAASKRGIRAGERDRDLARCQGELKLEAPSRPESVPLQSPAPVPTGDEGEDAREFGHGWPEMVREARMILTARYHEYFQASTCLSAAGLPTSEPPTAEEFIQGLDWAQIPSWHPYLEAARVGRYAEARDACPLA